MLNKKGVDSNEKKHTEFIVEWDKGYRIKKELQREGIPHFLKDSEGKLIFEFDDLPVRIFGKIWRVFKR
ncbi:hypothetical protein [Brevibacillus choshinensis]|uniref:hypothetical protein n=1 Tax=Brevibacillus choshinensis TaxID=54911 RepID=UPI002E240584|nr:hypothetical protein [Brevibacillus choshinensis]